MTLSLDNGADQSPFARLARKIAPDSTLLRAWTLHGGISAQVTAMEIQQADGETRRLIVRQHGAADFARNPNIAADEFALLRVLHDAGLPAPAPCLVDQSGELFATPVVVVEYIDGESLFTLDAEPDLVPRLAAQLAQIHQVKCSSGALAFLPQQDDLVAAKLNNRRTALDESLEEEGRIRETLAAAWPWPGRNAVGLLHGDYWPGNVLWREGRLVGVIDWEDAALGDPLADLGNSRLEVLWAFGVDAMRHFTDEYVSHMPVDRANLPYWDLYAALRHIPHISAIADGDAAAEAQLRQRHRLFVAQAFACLSSG